jgi:hypothetical protein
LDRGGIFSAGLRELRIARAEVLIYWYFDRVEELRLDLDERYKGTKVQGTKGTTGTKGLGIAALASLITDLIEPHFPLSIHLFQHLQHDS